MKTTPVIMDADAIGIVDRAPMHAALLPGAEHMATWVAGLTAGRPAADGFHLIQAAVRVPTAVRERNEACGAVAGRAPAPFFATPASTTVDIRSVRLEHSPG